MKSTLKSFVPRPWKTMASRAWLSVRPRPQCDRPNDPSEWERAYLTPIVAVSSLSHPVARELAALTKEGDLLLETGCGSATLSAELATAGRVIELADFSDKILARATDLFRASNLPLKKTTRCDLTQPLPWSDRSVDTVWSSGVLEHWTDEELVPIVCEMQRIARKSVVSLVPYAGSLLYRLAKYEAERLGRWPYGRELPRESLKQVFEVAGLRNIRESILWEEVAPGLLDLVDPKLHRIVQDWWDSLSPDDPAKRNQGYLLLTVGEIAS